MLDGYLHCGRGSIDNIQVTDVGLVANECFYTHKTAQRRNPNYQATIFGMSHSRHRFDFWVILRKARHTHTHEQPQKKTPLHRMLIVRTHTHMHTI